MILNEETFLSLPSLHTSNHSCGFLSETTKHSAPFSAEYFEVLRLSQGARWTKQHGGMMRTPAVHNPAMCQPVLFTAGHEELGMWAKFSLWKSLKFSGWDKFLLRIVKTNKTFLQVVICKTFTDNQYLVFFFLFCHTLFVRAASLHSGCLSCSSAC